MRPGVNGTVDRVRPRLAASLTPALPASTIRSAIETRLPPRCAGVERVADALEHASTFASAVGRSPASPSAARGVSAPVRATALVRAAERRRRRPGGRDELRHREARCSTCDFNVAASRSSISGWSTAGSGSCRAVPPPEPPDPGSATGAHVAVRELEPGPRECVRKLVRVLEEAPRDLLVGRIEAQRKVGREHRRRVPLRRVVRVGTEPAPAPPLPLVRAGGLFVSSHSYANRLRK